MLSINVLDDSFNKNINKEFVMPIYIRNSKKKVASFSNFKKRKKMNNNKAIIKNLEYLIDALVVKYNCDSDCQIGLLSSSKYS